MARWNWGVLAIAFVGSLPLAACSHLHLTQNPHQVIARTGDYDNFDDYRKAPDDHSRAGPVAARVLPYAVLAEQSEASKVYERGKAAPQPRACLGDESVPCDKADLDRDERRANNLLGRWRLISTCDGPEKCNTDSPHGLGRVDGLGVQIWVSRGAICREAIIAFRGTVPGSVGDWVSNFHWFIRALPVYDQYDQVRDNIGRFVDEITKLDCFRDPGTRIVTLGHSLGGGLAQIAAYADHRVRRIYAFDPSPVTGYYSGGLTNRDANVAGLRSERIYEHGEILAYLRYFARQFVPPTPCDPRIVNLRFDLLHGSPLDQHGIGDFTSALLRESRNDASERDPIVDRSCPAGAQRASRGSENISAATHVPFSGASGRFQSLAMSFSVTCGIGAGSARTGWGGARRATGGVGGASRAGRNPW